MHVSSEVEFLADQFLCSMADVHAKSMYKTIKVYTLFPEPAGSRSMDKQVWTCKSCCLFSFFN